MTAIENGATPCHLCAAFSQMYCGYCWCALFKDMTSKPCAYFVTASPTITTADFAGVRNTKDTEI